MKAVVELELEVPHSGNVLHLLETYELAELLTA